MRGHQPLIEMRMARQKPRGVWIAHRPSAFCMNWNRYGDMMHYPEVEILPTENLESLDLRFVVGLVVHAGGCEDFKRSKELHQALLAAKALRVITVSGKTIIDSNWGVWHDYVPE